MYTGFWLCFFVLFLHSLNVLSISLPYTDVRDAQLTMTATTTTSSSPTPTSIPSYATRFTHRPVEPLTSSVHAKRLMLTAQRKIGFFVRWIMGSVLSEMRPTRDDFLYLRSLEDPVFMSVTKLPLTISEIYPQPASDVLESTKASNIQEILSSLEAELERRSKSERKRIVENLDQIIKRIWTLNRM